MAEIVVTREGTRLAIESDVMEFSGTTRWGAIPNDKIIAMGKAFCEELLGYTDTVENLNIVHCLRLISNTVLVLVAGTRCYEVISKEELEAFEGIFDVMRSITTDMIEGTGLGYNFDRIMYIREIFLSNTVGREDYDCKYRQTMIFPNHTYVKKIVKTIADNWEKLNKSEDFALLFVFFRKEWYHAEVNAEQYGDLFLDKIPGHSFTKPESPKQDMHPNFYAKKFIKMLNDRI